MSLITLIKCHPRRVQAAALKGLCEKNEGLLVAIEKILQLYALLLIIQVKNSQAIAGQGSVFPVAEAVQQDIPNTSTGSLQSEITIIPTYLSTCGARKNRCVTYICLRVIEGLRDIGSSNRASSITKQTLHSCGFMFISKVKHCTNSSQFKYRGVQSIISTQDAIWSVSIVKPDHTTNLHHTIPFFFYVSCLALLY